MISFILTMALLLATTSQTELSGSRSEESRLRKYILKDYEIDLRPVKKSTTVSNISVSMSNVQIMCLVIMLMF